MTTDITELAQRMKTAAEKLDADQWQTRKGFSGIEVIVKGSLEKGHGCVSFQPVAADMADTKTARAIALFSPANVLALVEALEKAQTERDEFRNRLKLERSILEDADKRIAELESRTVKLPDGWQFEECEIEGCENGAIFSVGTGSRNIHLCDKCAHEPQNSRLKKSPLSKRLPFKMSAGIKVEAE
ncbi:TPA: ead/Ea22-like family protein [Klebsiella pneumoniae]